MLFERYDYSDSEGHYFQSLMEEHSFSSACAELTQWCSDQRAFSSYFEENLLAALQVGVFLIILLYYLIILFVDILLSY